MSLGLRENLEKGKLLGDGDIVNPEPKNFSISNPLTTTIPADKPLIHSEEDHLGLALEDQRFCYWFFSSFKRKSVFGSFSGLLVGVLVS